MEINLMLLFRFKRILVLISHSQDFLNGVCTNIIHLHQRKLKYYTVRTQSCRAVSSMQNQEKKNALGIPWKAFRKYPE